MRLRLHGLTLAVLGLALAGSLVAAGATRSVRDENERRLLRQRAESLSQVLLGLGSTFEGELLTAAAYAGLGSQEQLVEFLEGSQADTTESGVWAVVERDGGRYRPTFLVPEGASTYFDGAPEPTIESQLDRAFAGDFVIAGLFGTGPARRLGMAAGVPERAGRQIVWLEFPLLAATQDDGELSTESLLENIELGLYVGEEPSSEALIISTFDGPPPSSATSVAVSLGNQRVLVVVAATRPLSGSLAHTLPVLVLVLGATGGVAAAAALEFTRRQQAAALALAGELRQQRDAAEHATSELQCAEADLRHAQRREAMGQLAGGISHDFNNLLAAIVSYAELVLEADAPDAIRADVEEILKAANRGATLTSQLLVFARGEPSADVEPGTADINAVIDEMSDLLQRTVGEDVALVVDLHASPAIAGVGNTELSQVLVNLVVNARHAVSPAGQIRITTRNADDGSVVLEVTDDGSGMDEETATRAFEPFFSTRAAGAGTGLGLATVESIVHGAGGTATIASSPGDGTTVSIVLPVAPSAVQALPDEADAGPDRSGAGTVVLVEDEEPLRRAAKRMLEGRGYRVYDAPSGSQAVARYLDTTVPDVLVTDLVMPGGINGSEVAERFRTRFPNFPVIFVSGYSAELLAHRDLDGDVRTLAKPYTTVALVDAVRDAVGTTGSRPSG